MKIRKQSGITLIALILTVIILVILSLVGISVVYNSRIIEFAMIGTTKYGQEGINENKILNGTENLIDSVIRNIKDLEEDLNTEPNPPILPEQKNTPPTKSIVSFNSKGTNYIKVNAKSEDADEDTLTYTLRYGTEQDNLNLYIDLSNQVQNIEVQITTPEDLEEYTYYYWRVDVSDGKVTTEGEIQTKIRTYCLADLCNGGKCDESICPKTVKTGTRSCTGTFEFWKTEPIDRAATCRYCNNGTQATLLTTWHCTNCSMNYGNYTCDSHTHPSSDN